MSKKSFIDSVEVKSPCTEDWEKMHGNDRVRFCDHCAKDVKNLSAVTRKEAMRLVRASGGNLCIRYVQNPVTKRPLFANQLLQITRRTPGLAAGVMSASVSLSTMAYAQGGVATRPVSEPVNECPDKAAKAETVAEAKPEAAQIKTLVKSGSVSGTIADPNGAVIPSVQLNLTNYETKRQLTATSNDEGVYQFMGVEPGIYGLVAEGPRGFSRYERENVAVDDGRETTVDIALEVETRMVTMGVVGFSPEYSLSLSKAVSEEDIDLVRELIAQGENINGKDENYDKITPLFVAVEHGNIEIVQLLLEAGAKVNARDGEKQTPLMRLDDDSTPELVELLLRHGAKVNLTDNENNTALIFAADRANTEVVKALIDAGADVNVVNKNGQTALMNAADNDSIEKVRMLLEAGAKTDLKNDDGDTAWDLTTEEEIENLLVSYGAEAKFKPPVETPAEPQEATVPDDQ